MRRRNHLGRHLTTALNEAFALEVQVQSPSQAEDYGHFCSSERYCVAALVQIASLPAKMADDTRRLAISMVEALRGTCGSVEGLVRQYDLSSREGVHGAVLGARC